MGILFSVIDLAVRGVFICWWTFFYIFLLFCVLMRVRLLCVCLSVCASTIFGLETALSHRAWSCWCCGVFRSLSVEKGWKIIFWFLRRIRLLLKCERETDWCVCESSSICQSIEAASSLSLPAHRHTHTHTHSISTQWLDRHVSTFSKHTILFLLHNEKNDADCRPTFTRPFFDIDPHRSHRIGWRRGDTSDESSRQWIHDQILNALTHWCLRTSCFRVEKTSERDCRSLILLNHSSWLIHTEVQLSIHP